MTEYWISEVSLSARNSKLDTGDWWGKPEPYTMIITAINNVQSCLYKLYKIWPWFDKVTSSHLEWVIAYGHFTVSHCCTVSIKISLCPSRSFLWPGTTAPLFSSKNWQKRICPFEREKLSAPLYWGESTYFNHSFMDSAFFYLVRSQICLERFSFGDLVSPILTTTTNNNSWKIRPLTCIW